MSAPPSDTQPNATDSNDNQIPIKQSTTFASIYSALGRRQSQSLFDQLTQVDSLKPTFTISRLLAIGFAAMIHIITLVFVVFGIALIYIGWPRLIAFASGLTCVGIAWALRPRFAEFPDVAASQEDFPALYRLANSTALSLGAQEVAAIVIDENFNASFSQVGLKRRGVLYLGLPLWAILDDQEKIALLAHELSHNVNGDVSRGFFVGSAINSLINWHTMLRPDYRLSANSGILQLAIIPAHIIMFVLSGLTWLAAWLLSHLIWRDSQRAEYLADYLASTISGTEAILGLLDKLHYQITYRTTLQRIALSREKNRDLFSELRESIVAAQNKEGEQRKQVKHEDNARLDARHPPTAYRIKLLQSNYVQEQKVSIPTSDLRQVELELDAIRAKIQRHALKRYRASLYYGGRSPR